MTYSCMKHSEVRSFLFERRANGLTSPRYPCFICEWVVSHMWMSRVPYMNELCLMCEWVVFHIWMSRVSYMNESCFVCEWVVSHIRMGRVSYANEWWLSHVTHTRDMSQVSRVKISKVNMGVKKPHSNLLGRQRVSNPVTRKYLAAMTCGVFWY